jgi:hypothetical protein
MEKISRQAESAFEPVDLVFFLNALFDTVACSPYTLALA